MFPTARKHIFRRSLLIALGSSAAAQIVYVDDTATGANDHSWWTNALIDLQFALEGYYCARLGVPAR